MRIRHTSQWIPPLPPDVDEAVQSQRRRPLRGECGGHARGPCQAPPVHHVQCAAVIARLNHVLPGHVHLLCHCQGHGGREVVLGAGPGQEGSGEEPRPVHLLRNETP